MSKFWKIMLELIPIIIVLSACILCCMFINPNTPMNQKKDVERYIETLNQELKDGTINLDNGHHSIESLNTLSMHFQPDIGWIWVEEKQVEDYMFYFFNNKAPHAQNNTMNNMFYSNCYVHNLNGTPHCVDLGNLNTCLNVKDFGALGNGQTLDTLAIRKAVDEVNKQGGLLYFPYGEYVVDPDGDYNKSKGELGTIINITSKYPVIIDFFNSTIKQISYKYPKNYPGVRIVQCTNAANVEIKNGTIIGDRATHDYTENKAFANGSKTHEFGHGVCFEKTKKALAYKLNIKEMTGDGIYIQNASNNEYITIIDACDISYCRRQGISIVVSDKTFIKNTSIHNIGDSNIFTADANKGTSPKSGIDIEPNNIKHIVNLVSLENTKIQECTGYGIVGNAKKDEETQTTVKQANIYIQNSDIDVPQISFSTIEGSAIRYTHSPYHSGDASSISRQTFKNCKIYHSKEEWTTIGDSIFESCIFEATNKVSHSLAITNECILKNVEFRNFSNNKSDKESWQDFGLLFGNFDKTNTVLFENVSIINCEVGFHGQTAQLESCSFDSSAIWSSSTGSATFKSTRFTNCTLKKINGKVTMLFDTCSFYQSESFLVDDSNKEFRNCTFN